MKTEYEKCLAGEPFIGSRDPKIVETILRTRRLLAQFNATDYADTERRQALLREMFGSMGKGVHVDIDFHCEYGKHIFIGDKVIINMNCTFVDNNRIDIGSNVLIASNVQIYTATHSTKVNERMVIRPARQDRGRSVDWRGCRHIAWSNGWQEQRHRGRQRSDPLHSCRLCGGGQSLQGD